MKYLRLAAGDMQTGNRQHRNFPAFAQ